MRYWALFAASVALLGLASCNSMSKEECVAADWKVIGDADGSAGYDPQERFAAHVKSCARIKVVPDQTVWYAGYQTGLQRYCTPLNGLSRGEAGDGYHNVCPVETASGFLRGYSIGQKAYQWRTRLNSARSDISSKEMRMDRRYNDLKNAKDDKERRAIRDDIDNLDREIRRARRDAGDAEYALQDVEREVEWFRRNPNATQGY